MKIVIDISEELYEMILNLPNYISAIATQAVRDGTPLPKGHGRLKDVDNIKTAFPCGEYIRTESVRATIDHEETIIEADKEVKIE